MNAEEGFIFEFANEKNERNITPVYAKLMPRIR